MSNPAGLSSRKLGVGVVRTHPELKQAPVEQVAQGSSASRICALNNHSHNQRSRISPPTNGANLPSESYISQIAYQSNTVNSVFFSSRRVLSLGAVERVHRSRISGWRGTGCSLEEGERQLPQSRPTGDDFLPRKKVPPPRTASTALTRSRPASLLFTAPRMASLWRLLISSSERCKEKRIIGISG